MRVVFKDLDDHDVFFRDFRGVYSVVHERSYWMLSSQNGTEKFPYNRFILMLVADE